MFYSLNRFKKVSDINDSSILYLPRVDLLARRKPVAAAHATARFSAGGDRRGGSWCLHSDCIHNVSTLPPRTRTSANDFDFILFMTIFLSVFVIFSSILFAMDSSDDQEIEGVAKLVSPIKKNKRGKVSTYYNMKYNYYSKLLHTFFYKKNFFF